MNAHPLQVNFKLGGTEITSLKHWVTGQYLSYRSFFRRDRATSAHGWFQEPTKKAAFLVFPSALEVSATEQGGSEALILISALNISTASSSDPNLH